MLQFGIRAHDVGKLPAETLADELVPYKPVSIQLALAKCLSDTPSGVGVLSPGYARRLRDIFERRNIAISVLGCYMNPVHPDPEARNKALSRFEEHLSFARDFGCAIVGTETGSCNPDCSWHPDTDTPKTFDLLCHSVERLVRTAERFGTIVGIEPVSGTHTLSTIEKTAELIHRIDSPNLGIIFDPVNLIPVTGVPGSQTEFFQQAFQAFGNKIVAVHAKDFCMENGQKNGTLPAGTGDMDYSAFFTALIAQKPYIDVLLENGIPASLRETMSFVRTTAHTVCASF